MGNMLGESVSMITRSASFPGSREPVTSPNPKALAPSIVAIFTISFAGKALLSFKVFLWKFSHIRICVNRSRVFPLAGPSVPRPTFTPRLRSRATGATPLAALVLEPIQWATLVFVSANSLQSASARRILWAVSVCAPKSSKEFRYSTGVIWYFSARYVIS